jgi:D-alanine-D-alanine ligase
MAKLRIGLLNKKRGNFAIQEKFVGANNILDKTMIEVKHHEQALIEAGFDVYQIHWGPNFMNELQESHVNLIFTEKDCEIFKHNPPLEYPLFIKPIAGRGSAGIDETSVVRNYDQLVNGNYQTTQSESTCIRCRRHS